MHVYTCACGGWLLGVSKHTKLYLDRAWSSSHPIPLSYRETILVNRSLYLIRETSKICRQIPRPPGRRGPAHPGLLGSTITSRSRALPLFTGSASPSLKVFIRNKTNRRHHRGCKDPLHYLGSPSVILCPCQHVA